MSTFHIGRLLYVIGNGFDLHHRIPCSYSDFGRYLLEKDPSLHNTFANYCSFDGNWTDFENDLAQLDVDLIIDEASNFLVPYSAENWSDAYHHDYQYEIGRIVSSLSVGVKQKFIEWVCGLVTPEPSSCPVPLLDLDVGARYLTFNYTNTLQKLYGVAPARILHIHNQAVTLDSDLVLGHGVNPANIVSLNALADMDGQDFRVTLANAAIDNYFSRTYKPTERVISTHRAFFDSLSEVKSIHVLGHSISEVDWPYFALIAKNSKPSCPNWVVSYYEEATIQFMMRAFAQLGVPASKITYAHLPDIHPC